MSLTTILIIIICVLVAWLIALNRVHLNKRKEQHDLIHEYADKIVKQMSQIKTLRAENEKLQNQLNENPPYKTIFRQN